MTIVVCKSCTSILHSQSRHHFVQCECANQTFADGGDDYFRCGGQDLALIAKCTTLAEAKRVAQTLRLKSKDLMTFHDVMVKRLSKKRADQIESSIRGVLRGRIDNGDVWNADYCQAFGILQGVAYALGFCCSNPAPGQPIHWFNKIVEEIPCKKG